MNLIELIENYQYVLRNRGRLIADKNLRDMGVHPAVRGAIKLCFNDQSEAIDTENKIRKDLTINS